MDAIDDPGNNVFLELNFRIAIFTAEQILKFNAILSEPSIQLIYRHSLPHTLRYKLNETARFKSPIVEHLLFER